MIDNRAARGVLTLILKALNKFAETQQFRIPHSERFNVGVLPGWFYQFHCRSGPWWNWSTNLARVRSAVCELSNTATKKFVRTGVSHSAADAVGKVRSGIANVKLDVVQ
jgi:hypothetical protein